MTEAKSEPKSEYIYFFKYPDLKAEKTTKTKESFNAKQNIF